MKKLLILIISVIIILILAACASTPVAVGNTANGEGKNETTTGIDSTTGNSSAGSEGEITLPQEMQLMLGTVKLEGTAYAIDAQQAGELLPLWKALRTLSESDTTANAEVEAVINQIQRTMTVEQMETINGMEISMANFAEVAEILGIEDTSFGDRFGQMTPEMQATMEAARASGEGPPGGFGGFGGGLGPGGGQGPGGGGFNPEQIQTAVAERGGLRGAGYRINTPLLNALIEFLENKTK